MSIWGSLTAGIKAATEHELFRDEPVIDDVDVDVAVAFGEHPIRLCMWRNDWTPDNGITRRVGEVYLTPTHAAALGRLLLQTAAQRGAA